ncbi:hypothetical protein FHR67_004196 [Xanthomonas arboricola]|jgi:hypothetical protein|nr:hypothetical protein [Xanthomonas campestris]
MQPPTLASVHPNVGMDSKTGDAHRQSESTAAMRLRV